MTIANAIDVNPTLAGAGSLRTAIVIANPRAGRAHRNFDFAEVATRLTACGITTSFTLTTHPGHATAIAREAVNAGVNLVVVCGGDGTLREVTEGMLGSDAAMLPLATGTTNVIAMGLGVAGDPPAVIDRLDTLVVRALDVGLCDGRPFLMQASTGIDAVVMAETPQTMKQRFGTLAVAITGITCWLRYGFPEIHVAIDGVEHHCRGAIVMSFPFYAGTFRLAPQVRADDGKMEVLLFTGRGRVAAVGFVIDLALGRHLRRRDVTLVNASRVRFLAPAGLPLQIDGEAIWCTWPVEMSFSPLRLRVLCAADAAAFSIS